MLKRCPRRTHLGVARAREATGRYAWTPYLHDPKLKGRCLASRPGRLCCGRGRPRRDADYAALLRGDSGGGSVIEKAGPVPHLEQPVALAQPQL